MKEEEWEEKEVEVYEKIKLVTFPSCVVVLYGVCILANTRNTHTHTYVELIALCHDEFASC